MTTPESSGQEAVFRDGSSKAAIPPLMIRPLSAALGLEILDVDLRNPLPPPVIARLREAWYEGLILLLRDQALSEEDQVRFAECFGPPARTINVNNTGKHPAVMLVSNIRKDGKPIGALPDGEMHFHTDQCYIEKPAAASMLYAIEVPRVGGNTLFANAYLAYETLPAEIKHRIDGRKAVNAYDYENASTIRGTRLREGVPQYTHPVVRTHPATGRKGLYVNRLMTIAIEGLPQAESDAVLNVLFDHQEQRRFIYEHVWRVGDILMWDNRCTLHARTDFSSAERRLMRRITILGEKPQ
jgi:alpha-ketoglutarate-dependent taurine dioxygenase